MLNDTDVQMITFVRAQILDDTELADQVPDGPWEVTHPDAEIPAASEGAYTPVGYPQAIKPVRSGVLTETVAETFDPDGAPPVTALHIAVNADPARVRPRQQALLGMLELCHRTIAGDADEAVQMFARQFLRRLAVTFAHRDGYQPAWAPGETHTIRP